MSAEQRRPLKLPLVGAGGIGKTSVLEVFRGRFEKDPSVRIVDEVARDFFSQHPSIVARFAVEPQGKIQTLVLRKERAAESDGARIILCDRSVIDAVVYVRAQGDRIGADELLRRVEFWLPTYHRFLLLDPDGVPFENDNVRKEQETEREQIHKSFLQFFDETALPYELISGSLDERIARVEEIIGEVN